jgi:class 3 adenylate cyclase/pimeloyl-ACP methyl ester carboxylesterase
MNPPETRYIDRDGSSLAYQVGGDGPGEFLCAMELVQHLDLMWTDPDFHTNFERAMRQSRMVVAQRRGFGLSSSIDYVPTLEQQADDLLAVMDDAGLRRPVLMGFWMTCGSAALLAARHPDRVSGLVLYNPVGGMIDSPDPPDWINPEDLAHARAVLDEVLANWGSGRALQLWDAALVNPTNTRLMALLERVSVTPAEAAAMIRWFRTTDPCDVFAAVRTPTLVLAQGDGFNPIAGVKHVASLIPRATFQELPGGEPGMSMGEGFAPALHSALEMITGQPQSTAKERWLGAVLFTDLVGSTELLARVGDSEYQAIRARHERKVRLAVTESGGRLVNISGDGTLSVFDGPSDAVLAAERISQEAEAAGVTVRAGVHAGEIQRDQQNVTGMTVHLGARVMAAAGPGEVYVSRTVRDLVAGSGLTLESRGEHQLKGIPGEWELFVVAHAGEQAGSVPEGDSLETPMDRLAVRSAQRTPALSRALVRAAMALERRRSR